MKLFASGYLLGAGAAINVSTGFKPVYAKVVNLTDGDLITEAFLGRKLIPFTSGGTTQVTAGVTITGATSGATAVVSEVILVSGTWAGGDAAGFFVTEIDGIRGTFGTESIYISSDTTSGADDASVTVQVEKNIATAAAVAAATGTSALSSYAGDSTNAPGFTIGSVVAESGKLLGWFACGEDL